MNMYLKWAMFENTSTMHYVVGIIRILLKLISIRYRILKSNQNNIEEMTKLKI